MDNAAPRLPSPSITLSGEGRTYVVMKSALLHNQVFCLGEVREMPDFGDHFTRLRDCGHVRCVDSLFFSAE